MTHAAARPRIDRSFTRPPAAGLRNPTLLLFAGAIGLLAAATAAAMAGRGPLLLAGVVNTMCLYALYTVTHEAVHRTAHANPRINDWLGRIAAALEGMTFPMFRIIHLQHHAFTNDPERDPDYVIGRKPRWLLPLWTLIRLTHDNTFMLRRHLWAQRGPKLVEHVFTVALQMTIIVTLALTGHGYEVLMLWLLPMVIAGATLDLTVAWLVHYPHESQHPLENTRMFRGAFWQLLTFGQNYHLVHHLWTRIPWFRYAAAAELAAQARAAHDATRTRAAAVDAPRSS